MNTEFLAELGWGDDFARQLAPDEVEGCASLRVTAVHRTRIEALGPGGAVELLPVSSLSTGDIAVGDWVLARDGVALRVLERRSLVSRKAAGSTVGRQLIAANLDALLVVSSCNADFNPARLERFLVLAASAGVEPVVVLTKADTCPDPDTYASEARGLKQGLAVVVIDAKHADVPAALAGWCRAGRTVALMGSSGVGKTTIANALTGRTAAVQDIREDDAKGRHTTTGRYLVKMAAGGWLIDTPGMREVQLTDAGEGIHLLFDDLSALALQCRFSDCKHDREPGCAVRAAIAAGDVTEDRLHRWQKLQREDRHNTETVQDAHDRSRAFGRMRRKIPDKRKR